MPISGSSYASDQQIILTIKENGVDRRRCEDILFSRYAYFIREGANKHSISQDDSFDAYSDTILAAIDKISKGSFEGRSSLKTYLYQIFHNKCVDLLRKKTTNKNSVHRPETISDRLMHLSDSARSIVQK